MNHSYNEVIEKILYVGSAEEAEIAVRNECIAEVFDVRVNGRTEQLNYAYTHQPIIENDEVSTIKAGAQKIAQTLKDGQSVYIHCGSGTGRAAVMTAAVLMETQKVNSVDEAIQFVKEVRDGARFQPHMIEALQTIYK